MCAPGESTSTLSGAWRYIRRASPMNLKFEMIRLVVQKKINKSASKILNFLSEKKVQQRNHF